MRLNQDEIDQFFADAADLGFTDGGSGGNRGHYIDKVHRKKLFELKKADPSLSKRDVAKLAKAGKACGDACSQFEKGCPLVKASHGSRENAIYKCFNFYGCSAVGPDGTVIKDKDDNEYWIWPSNLSKLKDKDSPHFCGKELPCTEHCIMYAIESKLVSGTVNIYSYLRFEKKKSRESSTADDEASVASANYTDDDSIGSVSTTGTTGTFADENHLLRKLVMKLDSMEATLECVQAQVASLQAAGSTDPSRLVDKTPKVSNTSQGACDATSLATTTPKPNKALFPKSVAPTVTFSGETFSDLPTTTLGRQLSHEEQYERDVKAALTMPTPRPTETDSSAFSDETVSSKTAAEAPAADLSLQEQRDQGLKTESFAKSKSEGLVPSEEDWIQYKATFDRRCELRPDQSYLDIFRRLASQFPWSKGLDPESIKAKMDSIDTD